MSEFSIKQYQNEVEKIIHFGGTQKETAIRNGYFDIYTVSKMLGHWNLKTTHAYAKIISQTKRGAADKITLDFLKLLYANNTNHSKQDLRIKRRKGNA